MRRSLPAGDDTGDCVIIFVSSQLFPVVSGHLSLLEQAFTWREEDYETAYNSLVEIEANMGLICVTDLVESNNRLYRLLDTALMGRVYDAGANPPDTITPAIPTVPDTSTSLPGLVHTLIRTVNLLDNALNGAVNVDFSLEPSIRALLQSLIDAIAANNTDNAGLLNELEIIAALLA